jgi:hypothetical protein
VRGRLIARHLHALGQARLQLAQGFFVGHGNVLPVLRGSRVSRRP